MKFQYKNTHITTKVPLSIKRIVFHTWKLINDVGLRNNITNNKIIIFGYPKSGSTAISYLLSEALDLSYSAELKSLIFKPQLLKELDSNIISYEKFVHINRLDFSKHILKECFLSYFMEETMDYFPNSKFIYVRRNLKDNIRSILNRLKLKGDDSSDLRSVPIAWQYFLKPNYFNSKLTESSSYVRNLALGWKYVENEYIKKAEKLHIINYEKFCEDKLEIIQKAAKNIDFKIKKNIENIVDVNYNIVGKRDTNLLEFFGQENYNFLESIENELHIKN